jgi:hypothetical protein
MLTQKRLRTLLYYDPDTGAFMWLVDHKKSRAGDIAGWLNSSGYVYIRVDGRLYEAHRLAWLYVNGEFPKREVDHVFGLRDDNRISQLREATRMQNSQNATTPSNNTSGATGVSFHKASRKWRAYIHADGVAHYLGYFKNLDDAIEARSKASEEHHPFRVVRTP